MSAMEKVAWFELLVSLTALVAVTALYPWLGNGATGAFGLLGLLGGCYWFLRPRGLGRSSSTNVIEPSTGAPFTPA